MCFPFPAREDVLFERWSKKGEGKRKCLNFRGKEWRKRIVLEIFLRPSISRQFAPLLKSFRELRGRAAGKLQRSRKLAGASLIIGILATPRSNFYTGKNIFESTLSMPSTFLIDRLTPRLPCPLPSSRVSEVHKLRAIRYRIIDQFSKCLPADFHRARLKTLETIKGNPSDG